MASFFSSVPDRRKEARELLRHAGKVVRYRSDVIAPAALGEIADARAELARLAAGKDSGKETLKNASARLDKLLRSHGGKLYPFGATADWTETFVIAAILAGGVRAFIFQPFKIPTNSMYPTFHGMTSEVYAAKDPEPAPLQKIWRKITLGAAHLAPVSPVDGEVMIPMGRSAFGGANFERAGKTMDSGILGTGLFKSVADTHNLTVGDATVTIVTPAEFDFQSALLHAYFPAEAALPIPEQKRWQRVFEAAATRGDLITRGDAVFLRTHKTVRTGEPVIRFDILTGDMVIVDRLSYNFTAPKVGDAFVFRTRDVPTFNPPKDDFYIKRLVGRPGDTLQVEYPKLLRNGAPATGNVGFDYNGAGRADLQYYGYTPSIGGPYDLDTPYTVPAGHYWAMGDNSSNSADSRVFGPVPEKALVGRALFILHPFTDRWGPTK